MADKKILQIGLVMPIAATDGLDTHHWLDVKKIIIDALDENEKFKFETKIVSESDSVGLIHKRIVQGLYTSDVVICDLSCRNPNVMFELGMRLAFDKPTIIIKDDKTTFTFDAGVIEHLEYPRDLRFGKILDFKALLTHKVISTYEDSIRNPEHSPFLKSFGDFKSVKIDSTEVTPMTMVIDQLTEIQKELNSLKTSPKKKELITSSHGSTSPMSTIQQIKWDIDDIVDMYFHENPPEKTAKSTVEDVFAFTLSHFNQLRPHLDIHSSNIRNLITKRIEERNFIINQSIK